MRNKLIVGLIAALFIGLLVYLGINHNYVQDNSNNNREAKKKLLLGQLDAATANKLIQEQHSHFNDWTGKDITPPEVWQRMHLQIFEPNTDDHFISFVIKNGQASQIGNPGYGANGLTEFCVSDLNNDGEPELIYTNDWCGSGVAGGMAVFLSSDSTALKFVNTNLNSLFPDHFSIKKIDDQTIIIEKTQSISKPKPIYGKLILKKNGTEFVLDADFSKSEHYKKLWDSTSSNKINGTYKRGWDRYKNSRIVH